MYHVYSCIVSYKITFLIITELTMNTLMPEAATRRPRPLGFYPALNPRELLYERMDFQEGVRTLNAIVEQSGLSPNRTNTVSPTLLEDRSRSVCSDRYNPQAMNDANFAKNFNKVATRIASARRNSYERMGTSSSFQETSVCSRFKDRQTTDMRRLQCEVLGSHLCSDCIRILRLESVIQEKNNMYPHIKVDTRSLVAPRKVQQFNSTLPSQFYNDRRTLECGCIVRVDRNFWNPIIYTETNVFDRLRQANKTNQLLNPVNNEKRLLTELKTESKGIRDKTKPRSVLPMDIWTHFPVKSSIPRYDMKVTVTFAKRDDTDTK